MTKMRKNLKIRRLPNSLITGQKLKNTSIDLEPFSHENFVIYSFDIFYNFSL